MLSSPKTYNIIRESEFILLPSQRTLKDYTNWFSPKTGFQNECFKQLYEDYKVSELSEAQRLVCTWTCSLGLSIMYIILGHCHNYVTTLSQPWQWINQ